MNHKLQLLFARLLISAVITALYVNNSGADSDGNPADYISEPITLRIVTFNVQDLWLVGKNRMKRMKALGKKLAELDPDIVGFQEAFVGIDRRALIESLAPSRLKFHKYFPSGVVGSGLLIASAYPIREFSFHRYTASNPWYKIWEGDWWAGKGVALVRIELPAGRGCLEFYNTHAQAGYRKHIYTNDYNAIRNQQMVELAGFINATRTGNMPAFLAGDMNGGQESESFKLVARKANLMRIMQENSGVDHIFAVQDPRYLVELIGGAVITDYKGLRLSDHNGYLSIIRITPILSAGLAPATTNPPPVPHGFVLGVAQDSEDAISVLAELNIQWTRSDVSWKQLTPKVIEPSLRLADVQGKPEQVRRLSQQVNWAPVDKRLHSILQRGIRPIVIIGHGYFRFHAELNGRPACPDLIGREEYLAQMYWTTRAIVERYDGDGIDDAPGIVIKIWQTENELNEAALTAVWGWRQPVWLDGLKSAWADWSFLTRLLQTLRQAVKDADPEALTLMNFHTDLPAWASRLAGGRGWLAAVREWSLSMDIIGMDAYPNYFDPEPVKGNEVGARVAMIKKTVPNKPVFIIETDYPSGPAVLGFSPENQARYVRDSFQSARAAGADAYFKFHLKDHSRHQLTLTDTDMKRVKWIRQCVKKRRWLFLAGWALTHANYLKTHFLDVLQAVEQYWGVFTADERGTAAYHELKRIAETEGSEP